MIKISKATKKEALDNDWRQLIDTHYGYGLPWFEKYFRFKAVENEKLIGTIEGKCEPGAVYINALMTTESARGRGIGTMLIKKAEEFGKKLGAHRSWLLAGKDWPANTFYKKLGFKLIGNLQDFFYHKDFVIYSRLIR